MLVKGVKEKVLPEPTDEWATEASEFETLERASRGPEGSAGARVQAFAGAGSH